MIEDAEEGKFDLILTKEVSRFARNTVDTLSITRKLLHLSIGVFFETDNIITLSEEGELRLTIMSSLAQDESRKMSTRVRFGFKRSIESRRVLGSNNIWGYRKDNCKLVIVEEEAEIVRKIFELYATGKFGVRRLCDELARQGYYADKEKKKKFAFSTINGILHNPKYKGYYVGNKTTKIDFLSKKVKYISQDEWVIEKDKVPAIVSEELWDKCQEIYNKNSEKTKSKKSSYTNKYTYSGKLFCKYDGQPYWRTIWNGKTEVWQCSEYKKNNRSACPDSPTIHKKELDFIMKMIFNNLFKNKTIYIDQLTEACKNVLSKSNYTNAISKTKLEISNKKNEKKNLIKLYTSNHITENDFEEMNKDFNNEISSLEKKLAELEEKQKSSNDIDKQVKKLKDFFEVNLKPNNNEITRELVDSMIERIDIEKGDIPNLIKMDVTLKLGNSFPIYFRNDLRLLLITHMIRTNVTTEVSPIVGSEKQSEELVNYLLSSFENDPKEIWNSNIFGRSLHELVNEGLQTKLSKMPEEAQIKLQETLERIVNEGSGGLICIIL